MPINFGARGRKRKRNALEHVTGGVEKRREHMARLEGGSGGEGGCIDHVSRKIQQPITIREKYDFGISHFTLTENKKERFGK